MTRGKLLLILAAVTIAFIFAAAILLPRFAIGALASASDLDIKYGALKRADLAGMAFADIEILDRPRGIGISAKDAGFAFKWRSIFPLRFSVRFDLRGVKFVKKAPEKTSSYDTLDGLVAMPFANGMAYDEITGSVTSSRGDITISDLLAKSDMIKLSVNGTVKRDNTVNSDIVIFFSDGLTGRIPPELTKLVLTNEEAGWKSLSVKLQGNYKMPTIQVSSKLFRLSIGVKEGS